MESMPEHDYVIVLKCNKETKDADMDAISELLMALERKGFTYHLYYLDDKVMALVQCGKQRLHKQYFASRLNVRAVVHVDRLLKDWLNGVGSIDFDHAEELEVDKVHNLTEAHRLRLVYDILTGTIDQGGIDLLGACPWEPVFLDIFSRHNEAFNQHWFKYWSTKWYLNMADFTKIRDQFGEQVALYFGFLQFYFSWLAIPAVWSIWAYFAKIDYSVSLFAATSIWAIAFIEFWARRQKDMAMFWQALNCRKNEKVRSAFREDKITVDPVTGEPVKFYSPLKRNLKLLITIPVVGILLSSLLVIIMVLFSTQLILNQYYVGPFSEYIRIAPTIVYSLALPRLDKFYRFIAKKLNDFENYRTENDHEAQMAQKMFVSSFLTSFASPLLYGLFFVPFGSKMANFVGSYIEVNHRNISPDLFKGEIAYYVLTGQIVNLLMEVVVPFVSRLFVDLIGLLREKKPAAEILKRDANWLSKLKRESRLPEYDVHEDYAEMVMQFGYVTLFSSVYPLAALAAFINNWIELRSDAVKICINYKRPLPVRDESIGSWMTSLRFFTWFAVITNTIWLFMFGSGKTVKLDDWPKLLVDILIWEHLFFFAAWALNRIVGLLPSWAYEQSRRQDWNLKRRFLRMLGDDEYSEEVSKSAENLGIDPHDPIYSRKSSIESIGHTEIMKADIKAQLESILKF